jgi:hypothetical protein
VTTKEHLSKHDREISEIRAIQKRSGANIDKLVVRTEESIGKGGFSTWPRDGGNLGLNGQAGERHGSGAITKPAKSAH